MDGFAQNLVQMYESLT